MYDEEFDWANPNYAFQHPAQLLEGQGFSLRRSELVSWVEDYWLELAQLAWNGYSEAYRGVVVAQTRTTPARMQNFEDWLTNPKVPSYMGFRDVWFSPWRQEEISARLFGDPDLRRKVRTYDPKSQLVIAFLNADCWCEGHYLAFCQDAYPINAKECSERSLNHMISKYGAR